MSASGLLRLRPGYRRLLGHPAGWPRRCTASENSRYCCEDGADPHRRELWNAVDRVRAMIVDRAPSPLFVAADMHGHRAEFREVLRDAGLIDACGQWSGQDARLWLLGDYVDRGPDGIGV